MGRFVVQLFHKDEGYGRSGGRPFRGIGKVVFVRRIVYFFISIKEEVRIEDRTSNSR
jgi:hypothetical protein